jgi:hypothetical protein
MLKVQQECRWLITSSAVALTFLQLVKDPEEVELRTKIG